jgi:ribonuclease D
VGGRMENRDFGWGRGVSQSVRYQSITDQRQLVECCDEFSRAGVIAFDTEFVSEDTYRPELCLIQVSADEHLYVIDPLGIPDLSPFWECLAAPGHTTVVHAGREELRFSWRAIGRFPHQVLDVQLAAAFVGLEYPAAYATLVSKLLTVSLAKGETRTNWRRRPLSTRQIEYALQDVFYLKALHDVLMEGIQELDRESWLAEELAAWEQQIKNLEGTESWRRVSGVSGLNSRSLAIVRELWRWREQEAERRNMPARRVLRDDLIVELARRQSAELKHIHAVRGLERRGLERHLPELASRIERALQLDEPACPARPNSSNRPQLNLLGQFLASALGSICRDAGVATSLVGTAQDVRDLVAHRLQIENSKRQEVPHLARGWRAQVVGKVIDELLAGQRAIKVGDPLAEQPLKFIPVHRRPAREP